MIRCKSETDGKLHMQSPDERRKINSVFDVPRKIYGVFFMDKNYMRRAIELAKLGTGFTNPNPLVGAVIVKDGKIVGEGYHERFGEAHAERNAINNASDSTEGADMYVTLEPCSHYGHQPPCCEVIAAAGIKNVYIGSADPNPLVSGRGIEYLKNRGVNVVSGVLKDECDEINKIFFHYITKKTPYVIVKSAVTIDGKCAAYTGDSKWVSNEKSRYDAHLTRKRVAAIMVGINTVINDNPMLNARCDNPKNPVRIVCDSNLRIPEDCAIVGTAVEIPTYVATVSENNEKKERLEKLGVKIIKCGKNRVDIAALMKILGEMGIDSVLCEGGSELNASVIEADLADKFELYIAPKVIGGSKSKTPVGGVGIPCMGNACMFKNPVVTRFGDDIKIEYERGE